jgi:alanine-glyoxylate transaminase/serine-glyoxylate transaminase/serine-pyruvate transaminase
VTSLGGIPVDLETWGVDAAYSASQKCLSVPPGMSPVHFSDHALQRLQRRDTPVQSWYLDMNLLAAYYLTGGEGQRVYHHTAPISMVFGLAEGLRIVDEEGIESREARHREAAAALIAGLAELGFEPLVVEANRLPQLTSVTLPEELREREAGIRSRLLNDHGIEIGAGLGALAGKIWRIGLMGHNARLSSVDRLLDALKSELG